MTKHVHHCGAECIPKNGAPWCSDCQCYVFGVQDVIDIECPQPKDAA